MFAHTFAYFNLTLKLLNVFHDHFGYQSVAEPICNLDVIPDDHFTYNNLQYLKIVIQPNLTDDFELLPFRNYSTFQRNVCLIIYSYFEVNNVAVLR